MLILIKMITQKTTIITLLCFWSHIICQEEDIIGVPLLTQLHLAKAKAMHNLAIAKAKLHPTSHLLLESNPMYTNEDSLLASAGYNNLKNSANLNSDNLRSKPLYDLKDVQTHDYSHPIHYELPKEDTFSKNDPLSIFNARNKEIDQSTDKANAGPFEFDIQSDVQTQTTTEHPILLLEEPTTNENQNLSDSNSTILKINRIHTTEPGTPEEHLQMTNSAHDNPSSDLKNIKNDINMGKYMLPPSQDTLPVNSDLSLFDLKTLEQSSSSDTEINDTLDKSRNLKAIQGINKQNNSYEHRKFVANNENLSKIEEELSLKTKSNSHVLPNARSQSVGFLKKSNDDFDEHNLKFASSNSDITKTLNSNTDSHLEFGMLRNNDKSRYMNSKNVQYLSESTSNSERYDSNLESSLHSSAESSEERTSHVLPIKSNVDNVENNRTDSKSENINVSTTDKANIVTDSFETQPSSYPPESKTESNTAKNGDHRNQHKPKLNGDFLDEILDDDLDLLSFLAAPKPSTDPRNMEHTTSIIQNFGNVKDYTKMPMQILLPVESTTANAQEINPIVHDEFNLKQNMYLDRVKDLPSYANMKERLLGKELQNSEMFSDHFGPTSTGNVNEEQYQSSRTLSQSNKYDQQNLEQMPAIRINDDKLRHSVKMNENPSDTQRITNYEIYSKNRNFNNRFRDEQLYPWSLNNMENHRSALKSPHTEDILGNSTPQQFDYKQSEDNAFGHSFHRLKQCIKQIHEKDLNSYPKKYIQQNIPETKFQARENKNKNPVEGNQSYYPERVGTYLLHFPPNQAYVGERYRREIRNLKQKKSIEKETRRQLPLISLIIDPYAKLDVPKTIKNFGTVTKNSLEDKKAPMYYFSNMLASMRNAGLATMMIPPQDMIIPADYKIINKKAIDNEIVGSPKFAGNSLEKGGVFHKVGSIMRQSIESGQEALQHVNDVAQNARRIVSSTRESLPRLFVPYAKVPEVTKARTKHKLTLIAPRFADVGEDSTSHEDDYVKVGHVLDALSLSHPQQKDVGTMKITIQPKSKEPRLQSRFGDTNEPENPGYYVVKNHLEGNALNPEEVHEIIDIFHTIKEVAGAKSLKYFLKNVRTQLENCTHNNSIIQLNSTSNEKVGTNLKFTKEMIEPFMGILKETSQEHHRKKLKRAAPKRNYYNAENAAFANFLAGYEIVSSINPEVYRTYFHEPLKINHSEDINLKEIQREIKNSKLLIIPPLLTSSKRESEKQNGTTFLTMVMNAKQGRSNGKLLFILQLLYLHEINY